MTLFKTAFLLDIFMSNLTLSNLYEVFRNLVTSLNILFTKTFLLLFQMIC